MPFLQQPEQLPGPHELEPHLPAEHVWPLVQVVQVAPPTPHAADEVPDTHWPLLQQPLQLLGPHGLVEVLHTPFWHASPLLHALQGLPPAPHAAAVEPPLHDPPWQQPLHLPGPHWFGLEHPPPTHFSPELQLLQLAPPMPHAVSEVPETQALP